MLAAHSGQRSTAACSGDLDVEQTRVRTRRRGRVKRSREGGKNGAEASAFCTHHHAVTTAERASSGEQQSEGSAAELLCVSEAWEGSGVAEE
jgi:hypothetical protein